MTKKRIGSIFTKLFWVSLLDKTKLSIIGTVRVLMKWQYALLAITTIVLFSMLFGVLAIGSSEWNLLLSALPILDKVDVLIRASIRLFTHAATLSEWLIIAVVILQGVTVALLAYTMREQRRSKKAQENATMSGVGKTTAASLIATLGLGCSACGTSLIIPIVSIVSTSAIFLGVVTTIIVVIALLLLMHSSWKMGHAAYVFTSAERIKQIRIR